MSAAYQVLCDTRLTRRACPQLDRLVVSAAYQVLAMQYATDMTDLSAAGQARHVSRVSHRT